MPRVQLPAVAPKRRAWNKGRIIGQKRPLLPKQVWAIRARLELASNLRDLALFNVAIDSKLRGCDLVKLAVTDLVRDDCVREAVAAKLGIDEVRAGVLPEDKKAFVEELRATGALITMAGDGVNDAPALAAADVGIAMGTGADVAVESAGITLLGGDLTGIVRARKLATATLRNIKQNLFFAFAYNAAGVPIAAGILYPVFGLLLSPMIAAAAMSLSSVSVMTNALRLRRVRL